MTLSLWAIRHPFLPLLAITLCSLLGLLSLAEMPLRHLPGRRLHLRLPRHRKLKN